MSKKGNNTNEPKKTPIYRASEMLLRWALPIVDSLPKSLASQTLGGLFIRDLHDCLDAITIALSTTDRAQKIQCIKLLCVHLTSIQTTMRAFTENRYVSLNQKADFLDLVNPITIQAEAWLAKWDASTVAE